MAHNKNFKQTVTIAQLVAACIMVALGHPYVAVLIAVIHF